MKNNKTDLPVSKTVIYLNIEQLTVAYSSPKNLKDLLIKAKLHQTPGREASKYYSWKLTDK